jgi:hypothetical protein
MKGIETHQFVSREGKVVIAIFNQKSWYVKSSFQDLPEDVKKQIREKMEVGELLADMVD